MTSWVREAVDRGTRAVLALLPAVIVGVVLIVLLRVSTMSLALAAAAVAASGLLFVVVALGLEGSAILLVTVATAMSPLDRVRPVASVDFASVSDVFLLMGLALLIPVVLTRGLPSNWLFLFGASGLMITALVTSVLSDVPLASLNGVVRLAIGAIVLPIFYAWWRPDRRVVVLFAAAFVAGNVFNIVAGYWNPTGDGGRRLGYSTHPNVLGLAAMLAVALVPFLLEAVPRGWRWLVVAGGGACAWGVWISGSRAALVVAVALGALYVILSRSVGVALAAFGASIPVFYFVADAIVGDGAQENNALGRLLGGGSASYSDLAREQLARTAMEAFNAHPILGNGLAAVTEAHNVYLQVAAAMGIIGVTFHLIMLGSTVVESLRLPRPFWYLVLPCMGYLMIGPLTTILWDRYVWCVLALPFLAAGALNRDPSAPDGVESDGAQSSGAQSPAAQSSGAASRRPSLALQESP